MTRHNQATKTLLIVLVSLLSCAPSACSRRSTSTSTSTAKAAPAPKPAPRQITAPERITATQPTTRPVPEISRVVIVSIDGLRPDVALRADAPHIRWLMAHGAFTFWARTTEVSITLPSHTSMLTGVIPRKHEVEWNKDLPLATPVYPKFPTLFDVAHKAGYTTALAAGKKKFETLDVPGTLDWKWITDSEKSEDADVAEHAVQIILEHKPQVMFVHLPSTDNVGHRIGWGTPEQEAAVEAADASVGRLLGALAEAKLRESTIVILTADHGGAGKTHLPDDARARHIPWIVNGPGIRQHLDLTTYPNVIINTEDTFATACFLLGIPRSPELDGKPIMEILQDRGELLQEAPAAQAR